MTNIQLGFYTDECTSMLSIIIDLNKFNKEFKDVVYRIFGDRDNLDENYLPDGHRIIKFTIPPTNEDIYFGYWRDTNLLFSEIENSDLTELIYNGLLGYREISLKSQQHPSQIESTNYWISLIKPFYRKSLINNIINER